jgi:hypothetical protein
MASIGPTSTRTSRLPVYCGRADDMSKFAKSKIKTIPWDLAAHLKTDADIDAYRKQCLRMAIPP